MEIKHYLNIKLNVQITFWWFKETDINAVNLQLWLSSKDKYVNIIMEIKYCVNICKLPICLYFWIFKIWMIQRNWYEMLWIYSCDFHLKQHHASCIPWELEVICSDKFHLLSFWNIALINVIQWIQYADYDGDMVWFRMMDTKLDHFVDHKIGLAWHKLIMLIDGLGS